MQKGAFDIVFFLVVVSLLIITMLIFIINIVYLYRKNQKNYGQSLKNLKDEHEKAILSTRLEIQEETFQHISREIHDNINLSLTLAKLHLNTILDSGKLVVDKIENSIALLSKSISELSNISHTLNAELIIQEGLIQSVENEIDRIKQATYLIIDFKVLGEPIFLSAQKELVIFRIIQEAFNNIVKHSGSRHSVLILDFCPDILKIIISDNGKGFHGDNSLAKHHAGLKNMSSRATILGGSMFLESNIGKGTSLTFKIPYHTNVDQ